jgi:DNA helicase-2/ATP-dependent DNA helicase PcrA
MSETLSVLDALTEEQREVAQTLRGPVCVLAGAGTGKTRTITHRIAHGVDVGAYAPSRVLALTFTAKAAHELRARLAGLGVVGVSARTFHAAALAQLGYFWPQIIGGSTPQILPGKFRTLNEAAETLKLSLAPETIRDVATEIEWRKVAMLDLSAYESQVASRSLPKGLSVEQLLDLQRQYESLKDDRKQIDFEDVLLATTGMLEAEPKVALQVREQYRFFTVDEYQDVSPLQHALLQVWLGDRQDLCVVGDPSQTIFSFAGATNSYLLNFGREYPTAKEFRLQSNYRSTEPIVLAANQLVARGEGALRLHAVSETNHAGSAPAVVACDNEVNEAAFIAHHIARLLSNGAVASQIAVLYRTNSQAAAIESALVDAGISYHVHGAQRFFDRPVVKQAIMTLRGAALAQTDEPLFQQVGSVLRSLGWSTQAPTGRAQRDSWEALNALYLLADESDESMTFREFVAELSDRAKAHVEPHLAAVTLSPIHSAKGLEWPHVVVAGCVEGLIPISYADTEASLDEERRLFYVAITRAETTLTLTVPARTVAGRTRTVSRFIDELGSTVTRRTFDNRTSGAA